MLLCSSEAEEARTPDTVIKSHVLYQLSYNPINIKEKSVIDVIIIR